MDNPAWPVAWTSAIFDDSAVLFSPTFLSIQVAAETLDGDSDFSACASCKMNVVARSREKYSE